MQVDDEVKLHILRNMQAFMKSVKVIWRIPQMLYEAIDGRELLKLIKFKLINLHLLRAGGEGGDRGEGWIASPTQWT